MSTQQVHALIPAAGRGTRFGGAVMKQYLPVCGKAVLAHTISLFRFHPMISGITVILAGDDQLFASAVGSLATVVETVSGGETRSQSVRNGLLHVTENHPESDWVLVHDAARPCLSRVSLDSLLEQGLQSPQGAILAMPIGDTLKRSGDQREIVATVDRKGLWSAQTPQLFPTGMLAKAIDAAHRNGQKLTDEASAMELAGFSPKLVMGSVANIKITHPSDLAIAEALLGRKEISS
jgi:2-C-methyl-D-erythritol 4-phosphate cytidylyltransferase